MSNPKTITKFATYGPNRGQSLQIGQYQFIDGFCEVSLQDASSASRVLCRYHDVCLASELDAKVAEYDAEHGTKAKSEKATPASAAKTQAPAESTEAEQPAAVSGETDTPADTGGGEEKPDSGTAKPEKKATGGNKKPK